MAVVHQIQLLLVNVSHFLKSLRQCLKSIVMVIVYSLVSACNVVLHAVQLLDVNHFHL